jgi:hypothetical protein
LASAIRAYWSLVSGAPRRRCRNSCVRSVISGMQGQATKPHDMACGFYWRCVRCTSGCWWCVVHMGLLPTIGLSVGIACTVVLVDCCLRRAIDAVSVALLLSIFLSFCFLVLLIKPLVLWPTGVVPSDLNQTALVLLYLRWLAPDE